MIIKLRTNTANALAVTQNFFSVWKLFHSHGHVIQTALTFIIATITWCEYQTKILNEIVVLDFYRNNNSCHLISSKQWKLLSCLFFDYYFYQTYLNLKHEETYKLSFKSSGKENFLGSESFWHFPIRRSTNLPSNFQPQNQKRFFIMLNFCNSH